MASASGWGPLWLHAARSSITAAIGTQFFQTLRQTPYTGIDALTICPRRWPPSVLPVPRVRGRSSTTSHPTPPYTPYAHRRVR